MGNDHDESKIDDVVSEVVESDTYTGLATAVLSQVQGGGARVGSQGGGDEKTEGQKAEEDFDEYVGSFKVGYGL